MMAGIVRQPRIMKLALPAAAVLALLMTGISELSYRASKQQLDHLSVKGQARLREVELLQRLSDAESGKRGYLLVGGDAYMKPYQQARPDIDRMLGEMHTLYTRIGDQQGQAHLQELARLVDAKFAEMDEVLRLFNSGKHEAALGVVRADIGRDLMDQVRQSVRDQVRQENTVIAVGLQDVYRTLMLNRLGVGAMTLISLTLLMLFLRQGRELARQREQRQAEVVAERDRLEAEVARRTLDLSELTRHLQSAREDERARLARELHDELGALLTAAKLDVARLKPRLQQELPDLAPRLVHLTDTLNSGIALKRRIIEDLRPSTLSTLGLIPALEILCQEVAERSGLKIDKSLQAVQLTASAQLTVYRFVQEALTNAVKYAQARTVQVELGSTGDQVCISVRDDGVGFDPAHTRMGSHGLRGMRFRVESERGEFRITSAPGAGTCLHALLPVSPPDNMPAPSD